MDLQALTGWILVQRTSTSPQRHYDTKKHKEIGNLCALGGFVPLWLGSVGFQLVRVRIEVKLRRAAALKQVMISDVLNNL
jgi:hypothetical protein